MSRQRVWVKSKIEQWGKRIVTISALGVTEAAHVLGVVGWYWSHWPDGYSFGVYTLMGVAMSPMCPWLFFTPLNMHRQHSHHHCHLHPVLEPPPHRPAWWCPLCIFNMLDGKHKEWCERWMKESDDIDLVYGIMHVLWWRMQNSFITGETISDGWNECQKIGSTLVDQLWPCTCHHVFVVLCWPFYHAEIHLRAKEWCHY